MNCPRCGSQDTIRHGHRRTGKGMVQVYLCKNCRRTFSFTPLPYINADPALVLKGMSLYNQGYSFAKTSSILEGITGERCPRNTIHYWSRRYGDIFTYCRLRDRYENKRQIVAKNLGERIMRFHKKKLRAHSERFPGIARYVSRIIRGMKIKSSDISLKADRERNRAMLFSTLSQRISYRSPETRILEMYGDEEPTDDELKRTLLINDAYTVVTDLPLHMRSGVLNNSYLTGTLSVLQIRDGWVNLLEPSNGEDHLLTLAHLLGAGDAVVKLCGVDPRRLKLGVFDREGMWSVYYNTYQ